MKKINRNLYFLENNYKTNNKIRKSIILTADDKYNSFFLSILTPILNNSIKGMSKVEFSKIKSKNYDLSYNVNFNKINDNLILNLTIEFLDLKILNDDEIIKVINRIFNGLNYNKKDLENAILDYENYLKSLEDQKDKFIKILLNDKLLIENPNYISYNEKIKILKNIKKEKIKDFFNEIKFENNYFVFEGKEDSLPKIQKLIKDQISSEKLEIKEEEKIIISNKKEYEENIKNKNQISLAVNFQAPLKIVDEHKLRILSYLYGRGVYSKLFTNVREKKSLCYSIYSIEDMRYGIDVFTGVDFSNKEDAIREIEIQFKEIQRGNFKKEFELAKKQYYNEVLSNKDNFIVQTNYLDKNIIYKTKKYKTEDILEEIKDIKKEEIEEFSKKFKLKKVFVIN